MRKLLNLLIAIVFPLTLVAIELTDREQQLISHVKTSIKKGSNESSKINDKILKIPGMSSAKTRHFLNNLCSLRDTSYLEIGCWKGSTWVAALYGNEGTMASAVAVDDWSEFGGPEESFLKNCSKFLRDFGYRTYSHNCFELDPRSIVPRQVNIYFYDGNHSAMSQELAFTYYNEIFEDSFIAVVDDWNWAPVQEGTRAAFAKLGYEVLFEEALPAAAGGSDKKLWWNGLYVAVIRKGM